MRIDAKVMAVIFLSMSLSTKWGDVASAAPIGQEKQLTNEVAPVNRLQPSPPATDDLQTGTVAKCPDARLRRVSAEASSSEAAQANEEKTPQMGILQQSQSPTSAVVPATQVDATAALPGISSAKMKSAALTTSGWTLEDCYRLALKQSEVVAVDAQVIKEAEAHFLQSLGSLLPQASYSWSQTNQDSARAFSSFNNNGGYESKFVVKQTLFSGFKEFAGMAGSRLEKDQFRQQKRRAEQLLFVDVVDAFYLLQSLQDDLKTLETIRDALSDRIEELKKREAIGRTRHSEVVNTESQRYNVVAEFELVKSQILIAQDLLFFLTGEKIEQVAGADDTPALLPDQVTCSGKVDDRPDVLAAKSAWGVAKKQVTIARSDLFPTVTLEGDSFQHRDAAPTDETWATLLKVDVPIFKGTSVYGAIKGAKAQARESELQFQRTKRLAAQDIHDSYVRAQSAILRYQALVKAVEAAELNYSLQSQDYRYNLVNNLDVLTAIQNLGDTRRNYFQALYLKKRYYWELQAAIGEIPFGEINDSF